MWTIDDDVARFRIVDTTTNEAVEFERRMHLNGEEGPLGLLDYQWSEGNYSCDCNRGLFFGLATQRGGEPTPCGSRRYRVEWIKDRNGHVLYSDF